MPHNNPTKRTRRRQPCFCPCRVILAVPALTLTCLWIWLLHCAISYDAANRDWDDDFHHHSSPRKQDNNANTNMQHANIPYQSAALPYPIFPPDLRTINQATPSKYKNSNDNNNNDNHPVMITWQSNKHAFNQDRAVYYPTFPNRQQQHQQQQATTTTTTTFLVALFDGHGRDGHVMADFVAQHFAVTLQAKLDAMPCCQSDDWIAAQFNATFYDMEALALQQQQQHLDQDFAYTGGCTATVVMRLNHKLYFANAGDSRTILASNNFGIGQNPAEDPWKTTIIWYQTRLDKPSVPAERHRILAAGGRIHTPPTPQSKLPPPPPVPARVIVTSQYLHDTVGLAMSRSLGDAEWTAVGVIPEPIVDVIDLNSHNEQQQHTRPYLIVASDGLWDLRARHPEFLVQQLGHILFSHNNKEGQQGLVIDLLHRLAPQNPEWYRDDITVIALTL